MMLNPKLLKPIILYENSAGSNGIITLNDSISNYKYIEIEFVENNKEQYEIKKYSTKTSRIYYFTMSTGASRQIFERVCNYSLSGTTITPEYYVLTSRANSSGTVKYGTYDYNTNYLYITKVLGYK